MQQTAQWISDLAARHREFADKLADRQSLMIPAEDPDYGDLGPAFPAWPHPPGTPSSSRPSPRSSHRRGYWNAPPTATWTWKPRTDQRLNLAHDQGPAVVLGDLASSLT